MLAINNLAVGDTYTDALTLGPVSDADQISMLIANAAVVMQVASVLPSGTVGNWGAEQLVPPSVGTLFKAGGVRVRNAVAGQAARVVAQLIQPDDPRVIGSTPFAETLTAAGAINPAGVNDWADLSGYGTWSFNTADAPVATYLINAPTDPTGFVPVGAKLRFTQGGVNAYGIVTAVGVATLTVYTGTDYVVANAPITAIAYSTTKVPFGFPANPLKWRVTLLDTGNRAQATPTANIWYNPGGLNLTVPIGLWVPHVVALLDDNVASPSPVGALSTSPSSATDNALRTEYNAPGVAADSRLPFTLTGDVQVLAVKTLYYLVALTRQAGSTGIGYRGDLTPTWVSFTSAYL